MNEPAKKPERPGGWLGRFRLGRFGFGRSVSGDTISADIGENARGVVVGKNVVQIGTLVIPTIPALAVPVVLLLGFAFLAWQAFAPRTPAGPLQMNPNGLFNVAVARFGEEAPSGEVVASELGDALSARLFEGLRIEFEALPGFIRQELQPQLWHDSMNPSEKGTEIGMVPGSTAEQREEAACQLAERINAHLVVYGNLPAPGSNDNFIPEVALCGRTSLRADAFEIVGRYQAGEGISSRVFQSLGSQTTDLNASRRLNSWTKLMTSFTIGLLYDLNGFTQDALEVFSTANEEITRLEGEPSPALLFFIGRQHLILDQYDQAQQAFEQARKIAPEYARAHIGLGSVHLARSQELSPTERATTPFLQAAIHEYEAAQDAALAGSPEPLLGTKAALALTSAYLLQGEMQRDLGDLQAAEESFRNAAAASEAEIASLEELSQHRLLGQAFLHIGVAYHQLAHLYVLQNMPDQAEEMLGRAVENYNACISQGEASPEDGVLNDLVVSDLCQPYLEIAQQSLSELE